jgi:hypothetical protein
MYQSTGKAKDVMWNQHTGFVQLKLLSFSADYEYTGGCITVNMLRVKYLSAPEATAVLEWITFGDKALVGRVIRVHHRILMAGKVTGDLFVLSNSPGPGSHDFYPSSSSAYRKRSFRNGRLRNSLRIDANPSFQLLCTKLFRKLIL